MKITLAILFCTFAVVSGILDEDLRLLSEIGDDDIPLSMQIRSTVAIMSNNNHIGTGLAITPYKILTAASNLIGYFKMDNYDNITVLSFENKIIHTIRLIETQTDFTTTLEKNIAVITLNIDTSVSYFYNFENDLPTPISENDQLYLVEMGTRLFITELPAYVRNKSVCSIEDTSGSLCASIRDRTRNFNHSNGLGSSVFTQYGYLVGIVSKNSGLVAADNTNSFVITMVHARFNYNFIKAAKNRSNDEMNRYRLQQLRDARLRIDPPLQC